MFPDFPSSLFPTRSKGVAFWAREERERRFLPQLMVLREARLGATQIVRFLFIARPTRIIQQRGKERRFRNKISSETGTRRWCKGSEQGKFLTYLNRAILPQRTPLTVHDTRNTWQVDKNSRIQLQSIASKHSTSARQFSKLPTNFSPSALRDSTHHAFPFSLLSSCVRARMQRIIPALTAASPSPFSFLQILLLLPDSSRATFDFSIRVETLLQFYR